MAQALPQPTMDTLAGVDARLEAIDRLEALVNEVAREKARHRSNIALKRGIQAWRRGDIVKAAIASKASSSEVDEALLADFLATLPHDIRCAFEFRHASWLAPPGYQLLEKHGVALCLAESEKLVIPEVVTANFVYSRLRMPEYSAEDRKEIAERVQQLLESGRDVYVFFKHEDTPAGALYAEELLRSFPTQTAAGG